LTSGLSFVADLGFDGKEERYKFIESKSDNLPVVFLGSFQGPSLYNYFTGKESTVISTLNSRQTQYDIWQSEKKFQNKAVFLAGYETAGSEVYEDGKFKLTGFVTDSLQTTNRIKIIYSIADKVFKSGDSIKISCKINNPCDYDLNFNHSQFPVRISPVFIKGEEKFIQPAELSDIIGILPSGETFQRIVKYVVPDLPSGDYLFGISLNSPLGPTFNSTFMKVKILNDD
jgi:hypothetical protein